MVSTPIIHLRVHSRSRRKDAGFREEEKSFSSSPPRPKKEEKSVWPLWRGRATAATRSLLIWGGGLLPIGATFAKP